MSERWDDPFWRKVQDLVHRITPLVGALGSPHLHLLTEQLKQASYSIKAKDHSPGAAGPADLRRYVEVARGCVGELDYQLQRVREGALPDRRPYDLLHREVVAVRRTLADILRDVRNAKSSTMTLLPRVVRTIRNQSESP